jgi:hypothetical protein
VEIFLFANIQTYCRVHPAFSPLGTGALPSGVKQLGCNYITLHSLDPRLARMTVGCGISHTNTKTHIQYNGTIPKVHTVLITHFHLVPKIKIEGSYTSIRRLALIVGYNVNFLPFIHQVLMASAVPYNGMRKDTHIPF